MYNMLQLWQREPKGAGMRDEWRLTSQARIPGATIETWMKRTEEGNVCGRGRTEV